MSEGVGAMATLIQPGLDDDGAQGSAGLLDALCELARFSSALRFEDVSTAVKDATETVVLDSLAVLVAGGRLREQRRFAGAVLGSGDGGPVTLLGSGRRASVAEAVLVSGTAMVALELDEGNKAARGHASAHVLPAVLSLAEARGVRGRELLSAFLAGHEVATRFGAATQLADGVHPHGNWGATGAAAGAARLLGASPRAVAVAIDMASASPLAGPFEAALGGSPVRNAWVGLSNQAGLAAALLAVTEPSAPLLGLAASSLGGTLGSFDAAALTEGLGRRFGVQSGYFKRHASCSYTHPAADLALLARASRGEVGVRDVLSVVVETHRLARPLDRQAWPTRLAAMFSVPYVVAVALLAGDLGPEHFGDDWRADPDVAALAGRVEVREADDLDVRLGAERPCRLSVTWADGGRWSGEAPNPVWDADWQPAGRRDVVAKAARLLGSSGADALVAAVSALAADEPVAEVVRALAGLAELAEPGGEVEGAKS